MGSGDRVFTQICNLHFLKSSGVLLNITWHHTLFKYNLKLGRSVKTLIKQKVIISLRWNYAGKPTWFCEGYYYILENHFQSTQFASVSMKLWLYCAKREPYINNIQKHSGPLRARDEMDWREVQKYPFSLRSPHFKWTLGSRFWSQSGYDVSPCVPVYMINTSSFWLLHQICANPRGKTAAI